MSFRGWTARGVVLAALALAIGGGTALAGARYIITSTRQIKPSVLKALRRPGPRGLPGAPGTAGTAGTNGAVADYYASAGASSPVSLTDASLADANAQPLISKTLSAGDYALTADVSISAGQLNGSAGVKVVCILKWGGLTQFNQYISPWDSATSATTGGAAGTISWSVAQATTSPSTVTIGCADYSGPGSTVDVNSADVSATAAINAVQVNSIG